MKPTEALLYPADWATTTVGKSIEIRRGLSWSKDQEYQDLREGAVPVIRISNVQERLELDDMIYISGLTQPTIDEKRATKGWSIIVGSNGNRSRIGNAVLVDNDANYLFASFLVAARPKAESNITPEFFHRWLTIDSVQGYLSASAEGSTGLNNLSHSFFKAMRIPIPPPEEQVVIAHILDTVDTAIAQTREAVEQAILLRNSLIGEFFEQQKHKRNKLSEFITEIRYGTSQAAHEKGWGKPTLRIPNVVGDEISYDDLVYVDVKPSDVARYRLAEGDLRPCRSYGIWYYVGRSAVFRAPDFNDWLFASYLIRVRFKDEISSDYVNVFLGSKQGRRELLRRVTTSAGNNNINATNIRLIPIPVPKSLDAQQQIVELANTSLKQVNALRSKQVALEQLKASLMHDLLTGKVRTNKLDADFISRKVS